MTEQDVDRAGRPFSPFTRKEKMQQSIQSVSRFRKNIQQATGAQLFIWGKTTDLNRFVSFSLLVA